MARRPQSSSPTSCEIDMTPMIDIVFQLITFFMFTMSFEEIQADERVKLPLDVLAKPPEVKQKHAVVMNIGFLRNVKGERLDPEPLLFNFGSGQKIRPLEASKYMEQEARLYRLRKVELEDVTIKIRADQEVASGIVQEVIKQCQDAGFSKFAISAVADTSK